jgi:hypothetical protein
MLTDITAQIDFYATLEQTASDTDARIAALLVEVAALIEDVQALDAECDAMIQILKGVQT